MKNIALALLFVLSQAYRSQSRHELDSLLNQIKTNSTQDTLLARNYHEIASAFNRVNLDSSKLFADKALMLSLKLGYKKGISSAYNALGIYYHLSSKFDEAILNYQKYVEICLSM